MRNAFFKFQPYLMGALIGYLVFLPPRGFLALGPWRPVALMAFMVVALIASTALNMFLSLPSRVPVEPLTETDESISLDVVRLLREYREAGFELSQDPATVDIRPRSYIWPLINAQAGCRGSVFATGTIPRRVGYDISSEIEGGEGVLTSVADPGAAVFPLCPGDFKELIPGATPRQLLEAHLRARAFLESRGLRFKTPRAGGLQERFERYAVKQKKVIKRNPLKAAVVVFWRASTKTSPYVGPLENQRGIDTLIQAARTELGRGAGGEKLAKLTRDNVSEIPGGSAIIEGDFTEDEARELARGIRASRP